MLAFTTALRRRTEGNELTGQAGQNGALMYVFAAPARQTEQPCLSGERTETGGRDARCEGKRTELRNHEPE